MPPYQSADEVSGTRPDFPRRAGFPLRATAQAKPMGSVKEEGEQGRAKTKAATRAQFFFACWAPRKVPHL